MCFVSITHKQCRNSVKAEWLSSIRIFFFFQSLPMNNLHLFFLLAAVEVFWIAWECCNSMPNCVGIWTAFLSHGESFTVTFSWLLPAQSPRFSVCHPVSVMQMKEKSGLLSSSDLFANRGCISVPPNEPNSSSTSLLSKEEKAAHSDLLHTLVSNLFLF